MTTIACMNMRTLRVSHHVSLAWAKLMTGASDGHAAVA